MKGNDQGRKQHAAGPPQSTRGHLLNLKPSSHSSLYRELARKTTLYTSRTCGKAGWVQLLFAQEVQEIQVGREHRLEGRVDCDEDRYLLIRRRKSTRQIFYCSQALGMLPGLSGCISG